VRPASISAGGRRPHGFCHRAEPSNLAEKEGFEPSDPVSQANSLAVSPIRPLSHFSRIPESLPHRTGALRSKSNRLAGAYRKPGPLAEGVGFEPTGLLTQRFSRPSHSAALPPFQERTVHDSAPNLPRILKCPDDAAYGPRSASGGSAQAQARVECPKLEVAVRAQHRNRIKDGVHDFSR
jgi:hypothetical protein